MRGWILVDTSALVGLFLEEDEWHARAQRTFATLAMERRPLITTSDVFSEVVTSVRKWAGFDRALKTGEILRASELASIVPIDDPLRDLAWALFKQHRIPGLSFADCTSFAVMEKYGISEAFTFDDDFRKAGYAVRPGKK